MLEMQLLLHVTGPSHIIGAMYFLLYFITIVAFHNNLIDLLSRQIVSCSTKVCEMRKFYDLSHYVYLSITCKNTKRQIGTRSISGHTGTVSHALFIVPLS